MISVKILVVLIVVKNVLSVERIVGGQIAEPHSIPHQVVIIVKKSPSNALLCGGSLINERTVLTAAHCIHSKDNAVVIAGAHNISAMETDVELRRVNSSNYKIHPQFNINYANMDIALIDLPTPVIFSSKIQPVQLPSQVFRGESFADEIGTVSGFGLTCDGCGSSQVLRYTTNRIMKDEECSKSYFFSTIPSENQVCVATSDNNSGNCRGDSGEISFSHLSFLLSTPLTIKQSNSGGPLTVVKDKTVIQIGLSSFGHFKCQEGKPTVFTRLTPELVGWIKETMQFKTK